MIARYNRISLMIGAPGILLQNGGFIGFLVLAGKPTDPISAAQFGALAAGVVGTVMLFVGIAYYAKSKGRSGAWALVAFLGWIGLVILALLKDLDSTPASANVDPATGLPRRDNVIARMSIYLAIPGIIPACGTLVGLIGIVCGIVGLQKSKEYGTGRTTAKVGIILNSVFIVVSMALMAFMVFKDAQEAKGSVRRPTMLAPKAPPPSGPTK